LLSQLRLMSKDTLLKTALILPIICLLIVRLIGFDGLYGMDSYEYYRYSISLKEFFLHGDDPGSFFWPVGYPILIAILSFLMPVSFAGQLLSILCLIGIYYYTNRIIKLCYSNNEDSRYYTLITVLLAPYLMRNGMQFMADLLGVFCLCAAAFYALKFRLKKETKSILLFGVFATYGVFSRYGNVVPLFPFIILIIPTYIKSFRWQNLLAFIAPLLLIGIHFSIKGIEDSTVVSHHFLEEWNIGNFFKTSFVSTTEHNLATHTYTFPNLLYYFGLFLYPGYCFLNVVFLFLAFKKNQNWLKQPLLYLTISVILNALFLSGVTFQGDRYLFPTYPLFIVLMFGGFQFLMGKLGKYKNAFILMAIFAQLGLFARSIYPSLERNKLEKEVVDFLKDHQNNTLYCFEMDLALQQRGLKFEYENLWFEEILNFEPQALVLFNEEKFGSRFEGKTPMINWEKLNRDHQLLRIKSFEKGWEVYVIEK